MYDSNLGEHVLHQTGADTYRTVDTVSLIFAHVGEYSSHFLHITLYTTHLV